MTTGAENGTGAKPADGSSSDTTSKLRSLLASLANPIPEEIVTHIPDLGKCKKQGCFIQGGYSGLCMTHEKEAEDEHWRQWRERNGR